MPGPISGIITLRSMLTRVHPSIIAASSRSLGISAKKFRSSQMLNGWLIATSAMARA